MKKDNKWMGETDLDEFDDHESFVSYLTPLIVFLVSMACFLENHDIGNSPLPPTT